MNRADLVIAFVAALGGGCVEWPTPTPPEPPPPMNACEAITTSPDPPITLLQCGVERICAELQSRGIAWEGGARAQWIECEALGGIGMLPRETPMVRVRLRLDRLVTSRRELWFDNVVVYRANWVDGRWLLDPIATLPVDLEAARPMETPAAIVTAPALSIERVPGEGLLRDRSASPQTPLRLSLAEPPASFDPCEGMSLWLARDLRWWAKRNVRGLEVYRIESDGWRVGRHLFVAWAQTPGGVLRYDGDWGSVRWTLSAAEWQDLRSRAGAILDAPSSGGTCGKDGHVVVMEALASGQWRVVRRWCDDIGGLFWALRKRLHAYVKSLAPAP